MLTATWHIVSFKMLPEYCKLQEILCFPWVCLRNVQNLCFGGRCKSTAPVSDNADVLRLPIQTQLVVNFFPSGRAFIVWLTRGASAWSSRFQWWTMWLVFDLSGCPPASTGWQPWGKLENLAPNKGLLRESRMLLATRRYQVGSDGCWPDLMFLETRRCQVGSDGRSSIAAASSKLAYMHAFAIRSRMLWEPESFNWHTWMLSLFLIARNAVSGDEARAPDVPKYLVATTIRLNTQQSTLKTLAQIHPRLFMESLRELRPREVGNSRLPTTP